MDYSIITLQKGFHFHLSKLATGRRTHLERWYGWHWCAKLAVLCPSATSWHPDVASLTTVPILLQELGPHYSSACLLLSREWFAVLPDSLLLHYLECQNIAATTNDHRVRICSPDQFWNNVDGEHRDTLNPCFTISEIPLCPRIAMWFMAMLQYCRAGVKVVALLEVQAAPSFLKHDWGTCKERVMEWDHPPWAAVRQQLLSRRKSMLGQEPQHGLCKLCVRNTARYSRTESSLSEAKKTSSLLTEFLAQKWLWPCGTFFIQLFFTCRVLRGLCFNSCCCTCLDCFPLFQGHLLCYLLLNCPCKTSSPCYTGPCPTAIWFSKCLKVVIYCHWLLWHTEIKRVWGNMFFIKFLAIRMSGINQE